MAEPKGTVETSPVVSTSANPGLSDEISPELCRICFGSESTEANRLVRPCLCSGSVAFVHEGCLRHWIESQNQAEPRCEICKVKLRIQQLTKITWSLCAFLRSSSCLIIPLAIPMMVVLCVTISSVVDDLGDRSNLGIFLGCLGGILLTVAVALVLIFRSCRTSKVLQWKILPQHSEDSVSFALPNA